MNKFAFEFEGGQLHVGKLTQDKKDDICDFLTAERLKTCDRMEAKGYRSAVEVERDRKAAFVKWGTPEMRDDLRDDKCAEKFIRTLLVENVDSATLIRLAESQKDPGSQFQNAMRRMMEDADPKVQTPPPSGQTPTGGAASS